ncbi:hypothetical protein [Mesorhizobium sp. CAU 1732]|uniref:hypothetical protein n=1 Tax=Mesorhizobium sp. CAU 1732 TaxID=3140358 RepID=UPI0032614B17
MIRIAAGLIAALGLAGAAQAEELRPLQARSIEIGSTTGVAYYQVSDDGFRVVATLVSGEANVPVRVIATLMPGQGVVLSVPQALNEASREVEIRRVNDTVTVSDISATVQPASTSGVSN